MLLLIEHDNTPILQFLHNLSVDHVRYVSRNFSSLVAIGLSEELVYKSQGISIDIHEMSPPPGLGGQVVLHLPLLGPLLWEYT